MQAKIAVLLSGGVDSSVALRLLQEQGHRELTAFYLKIWLEDELAFLGECPWEDDLAYCRAVCEQAGVPLRVASLQAEYHDAVVAHALAELRAGRTPSPDILCNQRIKFGAFFDRIGGDFEKTASGHYAQLEQIGGVWRLLRAPDPVKDQTYFLSALDQRQLGRICFPIGHLTKPQVRALAQDFGLPTRDRRDSQGICFLGKISYREFLRCNLGEQPGPVIEADSGRELGTHQGYWFYTIGQREGLGLGGGPWYVVAKDPAHNRILVSHRSALQAHAGRCFTTAPVHWISGPPERDALTVKIRHTATLTDCCIAPSAGGGVAVEMAVADPGIAPGQTAVFYDGACCLGGGIIETVPGTVF